MVVVVVVVDVDVVVVERRREHAPKPHPHPGPRQDTGRVSFDQRVRFDRDDVLSLQHRDSYEDAAARVSQCLRSHAAAHLDTKAAGSARHDALAHMWHGNGIALVGRQETSSTCETR